MSAAIHAATPALASSLRRLLNGLHSQKRLPGMDALLLRLYEPILFRGLAAANAMVRLNALHLLFDAFPLMVSPRFCIAMYGFLAIAPESAAARSCTCSTTQSPSWAADMLCVGW